MFINIIIMLIIFPVICLIGIKMKNRDNDLEKSQLFTKDDTNYIKGVATLMVVLAHYSVRLGEEERLPSILSPFEYLGPLGVAIFFFLSGYGIFVTSGFDRLKIDFLLKRLKTVYIPFVIIMLCFVPFTNDLEISCNSFWDIIAFIFGFKYIFWFVIVILIMYVLYYLISQLPCNSKIKIVLLFISVFLVSIGLFFVVGLERSYWYGNNLIFALGVLIAYKRKYIAKFIDSHVNLLLPLTIVALLVLILLFFVTDSFVKIVIKTLMGCTVNVAVIQLIRRIDFNSIPMRWIGKHSLYIYILHIVLYKVMSSYFEMENLFYTLLYFILILISSAVIKLGVNCLLKLPIKKVERNVANEE